MVGFVVRQRSAFTFIEVLATLLVVTIGIGGVVALVMFGARKSSRAQAEAIALATAVSIAVDPTPAVALDWTYNPIDLNRLADSKESQGYVNGLYVVRKESTRAEDVIARSAVDMANPVHVRSALVEVTVYEAMLGDPIASYATRLVRVRR